jgi:hypothetical protein
MIFLSFLALLACPGLSQNSQVAKLALSTMFLISCREGQRISFETHHKLYFGWLGMAAISSITSYWPSIAIYGFHYRYEGLLTYIVVTCLAVYYWRNYDTLMVLYLASLIGCTAWLIAKFYLDDETLGWLLLPPLAISGLSAVMFGATYMISRKASLPFLLFGLVAGYRAFLLSAMVSFIIGELIRRDLKAYWKQTLVVIVAILAVLPFTPLLNKIKNTNFTLSGSRSQWIQQAWVAANHMPLQGYGLDSGSEILKTPKGKTAEKDVISDRVHNIIFDILLWSGWFGLGMVFMVFWYLCRATYQNLSNVNLACFMGVLCYALFNIVNPSGVPSLAAMLICLFGITNYEPKP